MPNFSLLKNKVVLLRKKGKSYNEILQEVKISRSTLTLWLKNINLTRKQTNRLKAKIRKAQLLGARASKEKRINITEKIRREAINSIGSIAKSEFKMLGAMLYWGEGSKQSPTNISQSVEFVNSDPKMCKFFIKWIIETLNVGMEDLIFRIYVNEIKKNERNMYLKAWSKYLKIPIDKFSIYFSKNKRSLLNHKEKSDYKGQLRIVVRKSTNLNRKISGLIEGVCLKLDL